MPDGRGVAYSVTRAGVSNLWVRDFQGGAPSQLTHFTSGRIFAFAWSRQGERLAVARGERTSDVVVIRH
jgi:Tol biopolymer transport system component